MKKALAILLALALVAGAVFAQDAAYTLTGSASLTWGYNLDTEAHGFTNAASAELVFPLGAFDGSHGTDPITGMISIEDVELGITMKQDSVPAFDESAFAITAKILFPNDLYLQIASKPSFKVDYATVFTPWHNDDFEAVSLVAPKLTSNGGFTFGKTGDFSFALKVGSTNSHDNAVPAVTANTYMMGLDLGYKLGDMASIAAKVIYGTFKDDPATLGLGLKINATPITDLALVLAADFSNVGTVNGMDLMFTADYTMADMFKFGAGAYFAKPNLKIDGTTLDAMIRADLLAVENLTFQVGVDMIDLTADPANDPMLMLLGAKVAYKAMLSETTYVKPYANLTYSMVAEGMYVKAGVDVALIPLTVFTLDYTAGAYSDDVALNNIVKAGDSSKGIIKFVTKITY